MTVHGIAPLGLSRLFRISRTEDSSGAYIRAERLLTSTPLLKRRIAGIEILAVQMILGNAQGIAFTINMKY